MIREARKKDIPKLLEMLYELNRPKPKTNSDLKDFKKLLQIYLNDSNKKILVAVSDNMIVGMVSMMFLHRLNYNTFELYIPDIIVKEQFQHLEIGTKLINSCIAIGKNLECHRIRLDSGNPRKESHEFYKKLGFIQYGLSFSKKISL